MSTRLEKFYKDEVVPALTKKFGYKNPMEVPRLTKITINMGVGEAATNKKLRSRSATVGRLAARSRCAARTCSSSLIA
jgi:large subunit ribosomal protein L5